MEVYEEQSVVNENIDKNKRKRTTIKIIRYVCVVIIGLLVILSIMNFLNTSVDSLSWLNVALSFLYYILFIAPFAAAHYILGRIFKNMSLEYDYFINGNTFRIVKIINRQKRKLMLEFNVSSIESAGCVTSEAYDRYAGFKNIKKLMAVCDLSDENQIYYIFYKSDGMDCLLHFQPNLVMKTAIKRAVGRINIIDKSFIDMIANTNSVQANQINTSK